MDSLFCKIGSLRALVPASPARPCEGPSDASQGAQATPRSVQICACRTPPPPSSHLKPSPAEEATSKQGHGSFLPSFNPLPLLSSHSAIPDPLKFLWFNRTNQQVMERDQDSWATGCTGGNEGNILLNDAETRNERRGENVQSESEVNDVLWLNDMETQEIFDRSKLDANGQTGTLDHAYVHVHDEDIVKKVNHIGFEVDDVGDDLSHGTNSADNLDRSSLPLRQERSWISRLADIKALWPNHGIFEKQSTMTHAEASRSSSQGGSETACHTSQSSEVQENGAVCNVNNALGCSVEVPYRKVLHTKESFSKFLQDASLYDMKVFAQLAFLCDTAYMIPDIQHSLANS